jgi:hypothetical protein
MVRGTTEKVREGYTAGSCEVVRLCRSGSGQGRERSGERGLQLCRSRRVVFAGRDTDLLRVGGRLRKRRAIHATRGPHRYSGSTATSRAVLTMPLASRKRATLLCWSCGG